MMSRRNTLMGLGAVGAVFAGLRGLFALDVPAGSLLDKDGNRMATAAAFSETT